jgi:biotin carboxyl carrier protein
VARHEGPDPDRTRDAAALDRLADDVLPSLIAHFNASGLGELEVRREGWRVRLRASAVDHPGTADASAATGSGRKVLRAAAGPAVPAAPGGAAREAPGSPEAPASPDRPAAAAAHRPVEPRAAASPAVGYFTARDGTAAGSAVRAGDVLGHVDVLGVKVEVLAPADGIVGRVLADPGEAVEYGQGLVLLAPPVAAAPFGEG